MRKMRKEEWRVRSSWEQRSTEVWGNLEQLVIRVGSSKWCWVTDEYLGPPKVCTISTALLRRTREEGEKQVREDKQA